MAEGSTRETALGVARARFVEGLGEKAEELARAVALLESQPDSARMREELRKRLHALYASAQVFRIEPLASTLREGILKLDAARDAGRAIDGDDLSVLADLAARLPVLAGAKQGSEPPPVRVFKPPSDRPAGEPPPKKAASEPAARRDSGRPEFKTLQGVAPPPGSQPPPLAPSERPPRPGGTFTTGGRPSEHPSRPGTLRTVISVLLLDGLEQHSRVRGILPAERFELLAASDAEEALRIARSSAPDIAIADYGRATQPGADFVARLHEDPLTDFVPVVFLVPPGSGIDPVILRDAGADEILTSDVDGEKLVRAIGRLTGTLDDASSSFDALGDVTLDQLADRLADELRRGLVDAVEHGRDLRIPVGEGSEVLAAAWAAIARVRTHVAQRSGGRVRFRDSARHRGPALMALVEDDDAEAVDDGATEVSLVGRRIIVADDDPAVVWFFAGLLREEGADVVEACDGVDALEAARRKRPDLVISDILMPNLDGFGLCRELEREPDLADVPVILLSWKEDFLQRMRELQAGASAYLRKEAGSAQILARVRAVLRPRSRLEARLRAGGEVRGRIERLGVVPLLRTVAAVRPNARVTVRDAWNMFEVDVRDGTIVDVTRTASDGSFSRGRAALPQLVGCTSGRYTVADSESAVRPSLSGSIDEVLGEGTRRLGAVLDAISGRGLSQADAVRFDDDVVVPFVRSSPGPVRQLVEKLAAGSGPRRLLIDGEVAPHTLESVLVDLARRGAIREVRGPSGEDRIADALAVRGGIARAAAAAQLAAEVEDAQTREFQPPALAPPPEEPDAAADAPTDVRDLDWLSPSENTADIVAAAHLATAEKAAAERREEEKREQRRDSDVSALDQPFDGDTEVIKAAAKKPAKLDTESDEARPSSRPPPPLPKPPVRTEEQPLELTKPASKRPAPAAAAAEPARGAGPTAAIAPPPPDDDEVPIAPKLTPSDRPGRAPSAAPGASSGWMVTMALVVVAGLIGFVGFRMIDSGSEGETAEQQGATDPPAVGARGSAVYVDPASNDRAGADRAGGDTAEAPSEAPLAYGRSGALIDAGVRVGPGEGLLVVRASAAAAGTRIQIREHGVVAGREPRAYPPRAVPSAIALPEGRYELTFAQGGRERYRYVNVRAGRSLEVDADAP